jgi:hypothetical protein
MAALDTSTQAAGGSVDAWKNGLLGDWTDKFGQEQSNVQVFTGDIEKVRSIRTCQVHKTWANLTTGAILHVRVVIFQNLRWHGISTYALARHWYGSTPGGTALAVIAGGPALAEIVGGSAIGYQVEIK